MVIVSAAGQNFYVDKKLHAKWGTIKDGKLAQLDEDRVYIVDGREGCGKSVWTMQQAAAIDPTLFEEALKTGKLPRICFTGEDTLHAIRNTRSTKDHTKVIIFDEAFRGLASTGALSKINRQIIQVLMEMRQNNLVLFIVLPLFSMLDKYALMNRGNALFHIHKPTQRSTKSRSPRKFYIYNYVQKGMLALMDKKKSFNYPYRSKVHGNFFNKYPGGPEFEKIYRREKQRAFREVGKKLQGETEESKANLQRNIALYRIHKDLDVSQVKIASWFNYPEIKMSRSGVSASVINGGKWLASQKSPQSRDQK